MVKKKLIQIHIWIIYYIYLLYIIYLDIYSAMKKNEILTFATAWYKPDKDKISYDITDMCNLKTSKLKETERIVVARGCGWGYWGDVAQKLQTPS